MSTQHQQQSPACQPGSPAAATRIVQGWTADNRMVRSVAACPSTSCRLLATIAVRGGGLARDVTNVTVAAPTDPVPCGHTDNLMPDHETGATPPGPAPSGDTAAAAGDARTAGARDEQALMMARRLPDALRRSGSREAATVWAYLDILGGLSRPARVPDR